jgi:DNA-3-methyladenine glycosylase
MGRDFFARPAREVAPELLGCVLEHDTADGRVAVELTEVEAYEGLLDPASHSYRGRTERNAIMWGPPGRAYVYFTYGMHFCTNVVCQPEGTSAAVLIRAGRVSAGGQLARRRRLAAQRAPAQHPGPGQGPDLPVRTLPDRDLARGPARLCQALAITRVENGLDYCDPASPLRLYPPADPGWTADVGSSGRVSTGPRVGVTAAMDVPWRFWLTGDSTVSAYRLHKPRPR